jgi:hypothetical protein
MDSLHGGPKDTAVEAGRVPSLTGGTDNETDDRKLTRKGVRRRRQQKRRWG